MATLIVTETTPGTTAYKKPERIENAVFEEVGRFSLSVGGEVVRRIGAYLGPGYRDKQTKIVVEETGVVYEGCTLDQEGMRNIINFLRRG